MKKALVTGGTGFIGSNLCRSATRFVMKSYDMLKVA
ncbi:MAG: NAD-dependent epimerase/dehydratase family protein [Cetobacterium sp.]